MELKEFLTTYRVPKSSISSYITHTSIGNGAELSGGSYSIPYENLQEFYKLYKEYIDSGGKSHLTERFLYIPQSEPKKYLPAPICIDFDFRYSPDIKDRQHNPLIIKEICEVLYEEILRLFVIKTKDETTLIVQEKPNIYYDTKKNIVKDGIHFIFPFLIAKPIVQLLLRNNVLPKISEILKDLPHQNTMKDIYDEAVCKFSSGWMMPYSSKPGCEFYKTSIVYKYNKGKLEECQKDYSISDLSIQKNHRIPESTYRQEIINYIEQEENKLKKVNQQKILMMIPTEKDAKNVYNLVESLVELLNINRADDYTEWIRVGMCLHNINKKHLLPIWIKFSKRSDKYVEGQCEYRWRSFRNDRGGPSMASLKHWAEMDSPGKSNDIINKSELIEDVLKKSLKSTHYNLAEVIKSRSMEKFKATTKTWYMFNGIRWEEIPEAMELRMFISKDMRCLYRTWKTRFKLLEIEKEDRNENADLERDWIKKCDQVIEKLEDHTYKSNIVKECKELFYDKKFNEKLDSNRHLICFNNGVYDLKEKIFREGQPNDYISMCTNIDYNEEEILEENVEAVHNFLEQVFPRPKVREYILRSICSCLSGENREESFNIWTGEGGNGKSKIIELIKMTLGDYACELPVAFITQRRAASDNASPLLARTKGKRFCFMQEPNKDDFVNIGIMKELTGNDEISARALYHEPVSFKPQFKIALMCNDLPKMRGTDRGTWRRINVTPFISTFREDPDPKAGLETEAPEFPIDKQLADHFEEWKTAFVHILIEKYKEYDRFLKDGGGNPAPPEVTAATDKYRAREDIIAKFILDMIVTDRNGNMKIPGRDGVYYAFKDWCDGMGILKKDIIKCPEFSEYFEKEKKMKNARIGATNRYRIKIIDDENDKDDESISDEYTTDIRKEISKASSSESLSSNFTEVSCTSIS